LETKAFRSRYHFSHAYFLGSRTRSLLTGNSASCGGRGGQNEVPVPSALWRNLLPGSPLRRWRRSELNQREYCEARGFRYLFVFSFKPSAPTEGDPGNACFSVEADPVPGPPHHRSPPKRESSHRSPRKRKRKWPTSPGSRSAVRACCLCSAQQRRRPVALHSAGRRLVRPDP
jgi:hypothetical protein